MTTEEKERFDFVAERASKALDIASRMAEKCSHYGELLKRCGAVVGETDYDKIPEKVEALTQPKV